MLLLYSNTDIEPFYFSQSMIQISQFYYKKICVGHTVFRHEQCGFGREAVGWPHTHTTGGLRYQTSSHQHDVYLQAKTILSSPSKQLDYIQTRIYAVRTNCRPILPPMQCSLFTLHMCLC